MCWAMCRLFPKVFISITLPYHTNSGGGEINVWSMNWHPNVHALDFPLKSWLSSILTDSPTLFPTNFVGDSLFFHGVWLDRTILDLRDKIVSGDWGCLEGEDETAYIKEDLGEGRRNVLWHRRQIVLELYPWVFTLTFGVWINQLVVSNNLDIRLSREMLLTVTLAITDWEVKIPYHGRYSYEKEIQKALLAKFSGWDVPSLRLVFHNVAWCVMETLMHVYLAFQRRNEDKGM